MRTALPIAQNERSKNSRPRGSQFAVKRFSSHRSFLLEPTAQEVRQGFPTDHEVVAGIVQGNTDVVMLYFKANKGLILNILRKHNLEPPDDYLGEIYLAFLKRLKYFDASRGALRNLLNYTVQDVCRDVYENKAVVRLPRSVYRRNDMSGRSFTNLTFDVQASDTKDNIDLMNITKRLQGTIKQVYECLIKGMSQRQIAEALEFSESYISICVIAIRKIVRSYGYNPTRRSKTRTKVRCRDRRTEL